jgi:hypothetical protein
MVRHLFLFLLAASTPLGAAPLPRSFTIGSFDRIRVEGPYQVTVSNGRAPFARAEGPTAAIEAMDLRVEGRTLTVRQRGGMANASPGTPIRLAVGTHELRSASLAGAGSLTVDRMKGLTVDVALSGPGRVDVGAIEADRLTAGVQGSGALHLAGRTKVAQLTAIGTPTLAATGLLSDEVTLRAEGSGEAAVTAKSRVSLTAAGTMQVRISGKPSCILRLSGSASVEGCGPAR